MKEAYSRTLSIFIKYYLVALAFITPLFFLTFTSEVYTFNKYVLLVGSAGILTLAWTAKMLLEGRVRMVRTPADIPVLIFLAVSLLATIFSTDQYVSLIGWYPRYQFSFLSVLSYSLIYFVATSNLDKESRRFMLWATAAAGLVLGLLTTVGFFGQYILPQLYTHSRSWSPIGSINQLVLYLILALPVTFSLLFSEKNYLGKAFAGLAIFFMGVAFIFANMGVGWLVLAAAAAIFLALSPRTSIDNEDRYLAGGLVAIFVVVALIFASSGLRDSILKPVVKGKPASLDLVKEQTLPLASSWKIAARATSERPLLGSGPGTYLFDYTAFKPAEMNSGSNWNLRFDVPGNDYLSLLPTIGIVGLLAFVFLLFNLIRPSLKFALSSSSLRANPQFLFLTVALSAFPVAAIFFDSGIATFLLFILTASAAFSFLKESGVAGVDDVDLRLVALRSGGIIQVEPSGRPKQNNLAFVTFIPSLIILLALLFVGFRLYSGEVYMRRALNEANQKNAIAKNVRDNLLAAIRSNSYFDLYHRTLMLTDLSVARNLNQKGNLTQDEKNTLVGLVGESLNEGKIASGYEARGLGVITVKKVPGTSPFNVANWETLALVYSNIGGDQRADASIHAKNTYIQAVKLDPMNPQLYESLGVIYFGEKDYDNAIKLFDSAVQAKADYITAHYDLAQALAAKGGTDNLTRAANELANYIQLLPANEATLPTSYPKSDAANEQLNNLKAKLKEASKSAQPQP